MGQSRPLFVYFRSFLTISTQIQKSVDGVLGIRTRGRRLVGADVLPHLSFYKFKQTNVGNVIAWKYDTPEFLVHHFPCLKKEFCISEFSTCVCLNIPPALWGPKKVFTSITCTVAMVRSRGFIHTHLPRSETRIYYWWVLWHMPGEKTDRCRSHSRPKGLLACDWAQSNTEIWLKASFQVNG